MLRSLREGNSLLEADTFTPDYFLDNCLKLGDLTISGYQRQMAWDIFQHEKTCYRAPRGAGKSAGVALAIWNFMLYHHKMGHEWKVATTAGVFRQLSRYLWPEIRKWSRKIDWEKAGVLREDFEILTNEIKTKTGTAFAMSSNDPDYIEGLHADYLLIVLDEAKAIPIEIWDALEGAVGTGNCVVLAVSTPSIPVGRFHEIHARKAGLEEWRVRQITLADAIDAGRIKADWAEKRRIQWGEESAAYRNYVLGEFSSPEGGGFIPLEWIIAAMNRYPKEGEVLPEPTIAGLDVAGGGSDTSVMATGSGAGVHELKQWPDLKERDLANAVSAHARAVMEGHGSEILRKFNIDGDGIGGTVCMILEEEGMSVCRFCGSGPGEEIDGADLGNQRAVGYWRLRQLLNPANPNAIFLPDDDELLSELVSLRTVPGPHGRMLIIKKAILKKELGRSTDKADAVMYMVWSMLEDEVGWLDILPRSSGSTRNRAS